MSNSVKYTDPVLCDYNHDLSKFWFVYFDITNVDTGETRRKQYRGGINHYETIKERLSFGHALVKFWKRQLKNGWNPFEPMSEAQNLENMRMDEALKFALNDCNVATDTRKAYRLCTNYIVSAAKQLGYSNLRIRTVQKMHVKMILKKAMEIYKWSNTSYNKYQGYLSAIFSRLVDWEIIDHNPAEKIKTLPVTETHKFKSYTAEEKQRIREYFFLHHYRYYVILMLIYHTGIRPKEALSLKIKDVDLNLRLVIIYPEIELENSKTKSIRRVPLNNHLLPFLRELQLENYPNDYYVFGSVYESGKGNRGSCKGNIGGCMHPDYFKPSKTMIKRDTITKLWKRVVIDKLGINKYQYAMKHTGADDKILAGMSLDTLRKLYGHSSKQMTERYAEALKEVYKKDIIENSPAF